MQELAFEIEGFFVFFFLLNSNLLLLSFPHVHADSVIKSEKC